MVVQKFEALYTGTVGRLLRPLPLSVGVADGPSGSQRILAVAEWSPDDKEEAISFYAFELRRTRHDEVVTSGCKVLRRFPAPGRITDLKVDSAGQEGIVLVAGTSTGALLRMMVRYRRWPANTDADMEWILPDQSSSGEGEWQAWKSCHEGKVTGIDLGSTQVVSVGQDGGIHLHDVLRDSNADVVRAPRETASYTAVKWASAQVFVTTGSTGGLEVWDTRQQRRRPASRSPLSWGHTGCLRLDKSKGLERQIQCLDINTSRPDYCATGSSAATIAVWDLRFQAEPVAATASPSLGDVTEVHIDNHTASSSDGTSVIFSTEDGGLYDATANEPNELQARRHDLATGALGLSSLLTKGTTSIPSFGLDPGKSRDLFVLGGEESILFVHRSSV